MFPNPINDSQAIILVIKWLEQFLPPYSIFKTGSIITRQLKLVQSSEQKPFAIVAQITEDIAKQTDMPKDIVVKKSFFDKVAELHKEIPKDKLFKFVETLNIPDEIYSYPLETKLKFFKSLEDDFVNFVSIGKDYSGKQMNVITQFLTDKANWIANAKSTGKPVLSAETGRTPISPSFPQGEVPAGGNISGVSFDSSNISNSSNLSNVQDEFSTEFKGILGKVFSKFKRKKLEKKDKK